MKPTETIEDITEKDVIECEHERVAVYGNDNAVCCKCGARIEIEELDTKYKRVI